MTANLGTIIDYTAMRPSKAKRLELCPKCGKVGKASHYTTGEHCYTHRQTYDGLGLVSRSEDYCFIPTEVPNGSSEA